VAEEELEEGSLGEGELFGCLILHCLLHPGDLSNRRIKSVFDLIFGSSRCCSCDLTPGGAIALVDLVDDLIFFIIPSASFQSGV
jgi:hypothetical protein